MVLTENKLFLDKKLKFKINILLIMMICTSVFPQKVQHIEIINANNTFGDSKNHPEYWRLIGEVSFKHNNIIMNCDSAYHFRSVNKIKAFGKIKINQGDSLYITGQQLSYFGKKNKIHINHVNDILSSSNTRDIKQNS